MAEQTKYRDQQEANQRAATVLAFNHLPQTTGRLRSFTNRICIKQTQTHYSAHASWVLFENNLMFAVPVTTVKNAPAWKQDPDRLKLSAEKNLSAIKSFYMYQVGAKGNADYYLT